MEDDELKKLLKQNLEVSRETLSYVKSVYRSFVWRRFFGLIKWGLIIGLMIFGFIQLQPYLDSMSKIIETISGTVSGLPNVLPTSRQ